MKRFPLLIRAALLAGGLTLTGWLSGGEVVLQDTLPEGEASNLSRASLVLTPGWTHAQQIFTDGRGAISSVAFGAYRNGQPTGDLVVELREDDGGSPGATVAELGRISVSTLRPFEEAAVQGWQVVEFETPVVNLKPSVLIVRRFADFLLAKRAATDLGFLHVPTDVQATSSAASFFGSAGFGWGCSAGGDLSRCFPCRGPAVCLWGRGKGASAGDVVRQI